MPKLSDTQSIILSAASRRDDHSLYPLPDTISGQGVGKSIAALLRAGFAEERETDAIAAYRSDGDVHYGLYATAAGLAAIGVSDEAGGGGATTPSDQPTAPTPQRGAKTDAVLALLQRTEGATIAELIAATGWLPHTTRAALTGLRKKGHAIVRGTRGEASCYSIASEA